MLRPAGQSTVRAPGRGSFTIIFFLGGEIAWGVGLGATRFPRKAAAPAKIIPFPSTRFLQRC